MHDETELVSPVNFPNDDKLLISCFQTPPHPAMSGHLPPSFCAQRRWQTKINQSVIYCLVGLLPTTPCCYCWQVKSRRWHSLLSSLSLFISLSNYRPGFISEICYFFPHSPSYYNLSGFKIKDILAGPIGWWWTTYYGIHLLAVMWKHMQIFYLLSCCSSLYRYSCLQSLFSSRGHLVTVISPPTLMKTSPRPSSNIPACFTTFSLLIVRYPAASPCLLLSCIHTQKYTHK